MPADSTLGPAGVDGEATGGPVDGALVSGVEPPDDARSLAPRGGIVAPADFLPSDALPRRTRGSGLARVRGLNSAVTAGTPTAADMLVPWLLAGAQDQSGGSS